MMMFGAQVLIIISTAMVAGGTLLYNFAEQHKVEGIRFAEQEHLWAAASAALLVPIGSILLLASAYLLFLNTRSK